MPRKSKTASSSSKQAAVPTATPAPVPPHERPQRAPARAPVVELPRVQVGDIEGCRQQLEENGVCVFENVASFEELEQGRQLFSRWLMSTGLGIREHTPSTCINEKWHKLGFGKTGVCTEFHVGQSDFLWHCRLLPGVREVWRTVWGEEDLITSFDGCGVGRNLAMSGEENWETQGRWYHLDQNGVTHPNFYGYQGLLNFLPATAHTGSTVVVLGSHTNFFSQIFSEKSSHRKARGPFVMLNHDGDERYWCRARCVSLNPGDFLVWDSRVVHCNQGIDAASWPAVAHEYDLLSRLVAYVNMTPRRLLHDENVIKRRHEAALNGHTGSHDPLVFAKDRGPCEGAVRFKPPARNDPRWALV